MTFNHLFPVVNDQIQSLNNYLYQHTKYMLKCEKKILEKKINKIKKEKKMLTCLCDNHFGDKSLLLDFQHL